MKQEVDDEDEVVDLEDDLFQQEDQLADPPHQCQETQQQQHLNQLVDQQQEAFDLVLQEVFDQVQLDLFDEEQQQDQMMLEPIKHFEMDDDECDTEDHTLVDDSTIHIDIDGIIHDSTTTEVIDTFQICE